jgi:hypothetical protein
MWTVAPAARRARREDIVQLVGTGALRWAQLATASLPWKRIR